MLLGVFGREGAHAVSTGHVTRMEIYCSPCSSGLATGKGKGITEMEGRLREDSER